ncbi:Protein of unknown function [Pyronema omphalodes CBS 100304]|uniref:Uncharacterized protein n=1 Tax=Pyronema omphalodes (strain CBS 100304) TaxID=1076935 RepID=U4LEW8_PYROM|nr:Protein of unknown function [Pyronema omphalodes CBS 100304]
MQFQSLHKRSESSGNDNALTPDGTSAIVIGILGLALTAISIYVGVRISRTVSTGHGIDIERNPSDPDFTADQSPLPSQLLRTARSANVESSFAPVVNENRALTWPSRA